MIAKIVRKGFRGEEAVAEIRAAFAKTAARRAGWDSVLETFDADPAAVLPLIQHFVRRESLPPAARTALQDAAAGRAVLRWLEGRPATERQLWLLDHLAYSGPPPRDAAAASELIDRLKSEQEARHAS